MKRITITGGTGRIGSLLVDALRERGDEVTILSRSRGDARWDPMAGPAPAEALAGRDAVVHLAGEYLLQRWNDEALRRIRDSREIGTRNLVEGLRAAEPRPAALVSASAVGYYGPRADPVDEDAPPGDDVLADVCKAWEREAQAAEEPRHARRARARRRRTGPPGRRAQDDAAAVPARRRRTGGRRAPADAVDPPRRPDRHLRRRDRRRPLERARPRHGAAAGQQPRVLQGARPRAAPAGGRAGAGLRAQDPLRRDVQAGARGAERASRAARPSSATATGTRTSTRRCAPRSTTLDHRTAVRW